MLKDGSDSKRTRTRGLRQDLDRSSHMSALVQAAARNDQGAWDELVSELTPVLRRVVGALRLEPQQVEDVVQAAWIQLFLHIDRIAEPAAVPGWLVTTARREAYRSLRAVGRELPVEALVEHPSQTPALHEAAALSERRRALRAAVGRLPDRQRALAGALLEDLPGGYAGVAAGLGWPLGSIGPLRARLMQRLARDPALLRAVA
jgi:RNA polymerase sigma factor (sigma-70 family)